MVSLPMPSTNGRQAHTATLTILKRFEFESSVMRSGVLAVEDRPSQGRAPGSALLIVRGAAASIEQLIGRDQLPKSYRKVCQMVFIHLHRNSFLRYGMTYVAHITMLTTGSTH